jgi:hypothetical protein
MGSNVRFAAGGPRPRFLSAPSTSRACGVSRIRYVGNAGVDFVSALLKNAVKVLDGIAGDRRRRGSYHVVSFSDWRPELDAALLTLPDMGSCPHELFRILATNAGPATKRILLVLEKDSPLAIVALRQRHDDWVPVTHYHLPGALFPVQPGRIGEAAAVLGVDLFLAWWRQPAAPPEIANARVIRSMPTFKMTCGSDIEAFWRERGHFNDVKRMRKRCEQFQIVLDFPDGMEWVTRKWEEKWRFSDAAPAPDLEDRLLSARYLEKKQLHHTVIVLEGDRPIAGNTYIVHGDELTWMYTYRAPGYDHFGLGHRLLDFSFDWATRAGYRKIDLGGGHDHFKSKWGPRDGTKWEIRICPELDYRAKQLRGTLGRVKSAAKRRLRSILPASATG